MQLSLGLIRSYYGEKVFGYAPVISKEFEIEEENRNNQKREQSINRL